ncbi:hypothetical protein [Jannaschia sp. R86511]|uniref:hypothetical protein n=1 Tax=Jannaschia sp. R86511 TaxID=3093853 RepID=UPI0036D3A7AB
MAGVGLAVVLAAAVAGGVAAALAPGDGADAPEPGSVEAIAAELARGQEEESAALAAELVEAAVDAHAAAEDVLAGLATIAPPEDALPADEPVETDPQAMAEQVAQARDLLAATGQGTDDHGVTRAALIGSLDLLGVAVETAAAVPDDADDAAAAEALARVGRDRDAAVELWQAGAARLDTLVVETGGEHVHLFLAPDGNPESVPLEFRELHED